MYKISFLSSLVILESYIIQYNKVVAVTRQRQEFTGGIMYKRDVETRKKLGNEAETIIALFLVSMVMVVLSFLCFQSILRRRRKARHRTAYDDVETVHSMQTTNASERLQSITSNQSCSTFRTSIGNITGSDTNNTNNTNNTNTSPSPITSSLISLITSSSPSPITSPSPPPSPSPSSSSSSPPTQPSITFLKIPARTATNTRRERFSSYDQTYHSTSTRNHQDRISLPCLHEYYWLYQDIFEVEAPPPYKPPQEN